MKRVKIDVTKIDKTAIHNGQKGKYVDLTLMDNKNGRDEYGNDGFVIQDLGKERREKGEKGPILGNWRNIETRQNNPQPKPVSKQEPEPSAGSMFDDVPF